MVFKTSKSGAYSQAFDVAGGVIINALISKGYDVITLSQLYDITGATLPAQQNGIRWAVRRAKDEGFLAKTKVRGVYSVAK